MGKRQEQKEATKEHLLNVAFDAFSAQGMSATTAAIANAAGVAHGTIFVHFPSSDGLRNAVIERFAAELGGKLHDRSKSCGLRELLDAHIDVLIQHEQFYTRLISSADTLPTETRITVAAMNSALSLHFNSAIERERESIKSIAPHLLFNMWLGLLHYYLQNAEMFAPDESVLNRHGAEIADAYLAMISK